jgi:hypothetical protein
VVVEMDTIESPEAVTVEGTIDCPVRSKKPLTGFRKRNVQDQPFRPRQLGAVAPEPIAVTR